MRNSNDIVKNNIICKIFLCFLITSAFCANAFAQSEEWYLIFVRGNAPKRMAFFVDMNSTTKQRSDVGVITLVDVLEQAGSSQYTKSNMEFRCNSNEFRVVSGENYQFDNTSVPFKDTPWQKTNDLFFLHVKKLACNSDSFAKARTASLDNAGKVDANRLEAELKKVGFGGLPMLLMTNPIMPDFDSILEVLWTKLWKAERPARTGIAKNKYQPDTKSRASAENLVKLGAEEMRLGYYDKAIAYFHQAVTTDPSYSPTFFYTGYIFASVGDFERALANYNRAIQLNPNDHAAHYNRGLIYFEQKHKFELAEADFTKAIQLDPQEAKYYFRRADLYESWGKDNLAEVDRNKFKSLGGNALPGFQNARRALYPNLEFDSKLAESAIQQGTSTLIGRACAYVKNGTWGLGGTERFDARNVRVLMFPVTPYLEKWYQLRDQKEDNKTGVFINRESQKYALISETNEKGEFVFSRLKPGKYFIQIIYNFTQVKSKRIYTGSSTAQEGPVIVTTDYYEDRDFYIPRNSRLESFVEIKQDGETKKVTVKNGRGILGCKDLF